MERVLAGLQWHICLVYIDDIIIFSKTMDDHLKQLRPYLTSETWTEAETEEMSFVPNRSSLSRTCG